MRRPRGPGGRFLTAEEIAVQKTAQDNSHGSIHSPSHDNDNEGEDEAAPSVMLDEGQPLARDPYQDAGSLANALSANPRQHIPQLSQSQQMQYATNLAVGNTVTTLQSSYPTIMQQMHPPPQAPIHYSNGLYSGTDSVSDTDIRRRTEEMIHYGPRGAASGGS
jgi:hypothetical protein